MFASRFGLTLLLSVLTASSGWAIINGYRPDPRNLPIADRVVVVILPGSKCTGTLLTDRIVLTAAHCDNANYPMAAGVAPHSPQGLAYLKSTSYIRRGRGSRVKAIDGVVLRRQWERGVLVPTDGKFLGDMMLLLLDQPLALPSAPQVSLLKDELEAFPPLVALGYGISDGVQDGNLRTISLRQQVSAGDGVVGSELDTFDITSPGGGALCHADSGGPAFHRAENGTWQLAGVYSSLEYKTYRFGGGPADGTIEQCQRAKWFTFTSVRTHEQWIGNGIRELYRRNGLPAQEAVVR